MAEPALTAAEAVVADAVNAILHWVDYGAPGEARVRAWLAEIEAALPDCRASAGEVGAMLAAARRLSEAGGDFAGVRWCRACIDAAEAMAVFADWRMRRALAVRAAA